MAPANPDEGQPGDARLVSAAAAAADEEQRYDSEDAEFLYGCVTVGTVFIYMKVGEMDCVESVRRRRARSSAPSLQGACRSAKQ